MMIAWTLLPPPPCSLVPVLSEIWAGAGAEAGGACWRGGSRRRRMHRWGRGGSSTLQCLCCYSVVAVLSQCCHSGTRRGRICRQGRGGSDSVGKVQVEVGIVSAACW
jgi:hypothetical protein